MLAQAGTTSILNKYIFTFCNCSFIFVHSGELYNLNQAELSSLKRTRCLDWNVLGVLGLCCLSNSVNVVCVLLVCFANSDSDPSTLS